MMKSIAPICLLSVATACVHSGAQRNILTIDEVIQKQNKLAQKRIEVRGWITECQTLSCGLFSSANETEDTDFISIGSSSKFDKNVAGMAGRLVIVRARLDPKCLPKSTESEIITVCTDRASTLNNPALIEVIR